MDDMKIMDLSNDELIELYKSVDDFVDFLMNKLEEVKISDE